MSYKCSKMRDLLVGIAWFVTVAVAASTAVTSRESTVGSSVAHELVTPSGVTRSYRLSVPSSLPDGPVPLVVALHGGGSSGEQFESISGFSEVAETHGFIVVYPDGTDIGRAVPGRVWNGGRCCGPAQDSGDNVDDVDFVEAVVDTVQASYEIDEDRVFAVGHSNGAIMAYRMACVLADRIAAIGVQAGSLEIDDCQPSRPVSVFHVHGTDDTNIPLRGGPGTGISGTDFTSPLASVALLASLNDCALRVKLADQANPTVTTFRWHRCAASSTIEMAVVEGGTHAWMGDTRTRFDHQVSGSPFAGYDSTAAIWTFLADQTR